MALSLIVLAIRALRLISENLDIQHKSSTHQINVTGSQNALIRLRRWSRWSLGANALWLTSFVVRCAVTFATSSQAPVHWLLWVVIDTVWFGVCSTLIGLLVERDDITEKTAKIYRPEAVVYMSTAEGGRAKSVFLSNFTAGEVKLSVSSGVPIFLHWPTSLKELISFPHPSNEVENKMHAAIHSFITCPLAILLLNYADWPWMSLIIAISLFLRFAFANRIDPQAWIVYYLAKLFEPDWWPGAPKRFSNFLLTVANLTAFIFGICGLKSVSSWVLAVVIILSVNQMLGFCLACAIFFVSTKIGVLPASVCERCMQRFVNGVPEEYCVMPGTPGGTQSGTRSTNTGSAGTDSNPSSPRAVL